MCGTPLDLNLIQDDSAEVDVVLPHHTEFGIGTWFNRAVMSSQAFSRILNAMGLREADKLTPEDILKLRTWLANGMERPLPEFIAASSSIAGAIYHLTDALWIIPALKAAMNQSDIGMVYDAKVDNDNKTGNPNKPAVATLTNIKFFPRDKTNIMHNKFLIAGEQVLVESLAKPTQLTTGSANYTTEGLTQQANLVHTFNSSELAELYLKRFQLLKKNPAKASTAKETGWSNTISVGDAGIRVFFSPEPGRPHVSNSLLIETIVEAIHSATSSVIFCLFTPTDEKVRRACFSVGDAGKMMFGLVSIVSPNMNQMLLLLLRELSLPIN